jgi:hypothetical protein
MPLPDGLTSSHPNLSGAYECRCETEDPDDCTCDERFESLYESEMDLREAC